jgi:hypothetical protein
MREKHKPENRRKDLKAGRKREIKTRRKKNENKIVTLHQYRFLLQ